MSDATKVAFITGANRGLGFETALRACWASKASL